MAYRLKIGARLDKDIRKLLTAQIGRAVGYLAGTIDDSASSIHATRKCLKRSRSILRIVEPALSRKSFRATDHTFRDIARLLSHDRDREVIGDTLAMLSAKAAGGAKAAIGAAIDELDAGSPAPVDIENREEKVALAIARLQACEPVIAALDIRKPGIKTLAQGFATTYGDGRKCLKTAYRLQSDEAFHTFRKSLQHHWRHCQLLAQAWPELLNVRVAAARELSQMVGIDHDLSLVAGHFAESTRSALDPATRTAVITAARAEQARLRAEVKPLAGRLYAHKAKTMEHLILDLWPAAIRLAQHHRTQDPAPELSLDEFVPPQAVARH
jgi:hypothetical protein